MTRKQMRELIVGPIATVPTAFNDEYQIDYGLMAVATEHWIEAGLVNGRSVLKVGASIGEGHLLRETEWSHLLQTVVDAARGRVPVLGAIHHKDTIRTIEDAKRAADLGVPALQISSPIFNLPSQDDILRYYGAVSDAVEIGIIIYITHWLNHGAILPETLTRMVDFEHVVAVKWSPPKGTEYTDVFELADRFNILDNTNSPIRCHQLGGHGFLIDGIEAYPLYYLHLWDLMEQGQYDQAQSEWDRFVVPFGEFFHKVVTRSGSDAKVSKGMSKVMGVDLGPPRLPSVPMDDQELAELRALMIRWGWQVPGTSTAPDIS
jgi:4-hydroxy-tetrahydrodipicolinate synthase